MMCVVRIKLKLKWKSQEVRDARNMFHMLRKEVRSIQKTGQERDHVRCSQQGRATQLSTIFEAHIISHDLRSHI